MVLIGGPGGGGVIGGVGEKREIREGGPGRDPSKKQTLDKCMPYQCRKCFVHSCGKLSISIKATRFLSVTFAVVTCKIRGFAVRSGVFKSKTTTNRVILTIPIIPFCTNLKRPRAPEPHQHAEFQSKQITESCTARIVIVT